MSPQEWQRVADELALPWGIAHLMCDGYKLTMQVTPVSPLRYEIRLFVNGRIKGEWFSQDCEERRRFLRPVQVAVHSPADKKRLLQGMRRPTKEYRAFVEKKFTSYRQSWRSFAALRRHLVSNNTEISIAPADTTPVAAAAEVA